MDLQKTALFAALAEVLFGFYPIIFPALGPGFKSSFDAIIVLLILESLALTVFLFVVYLDLKLLRVSFRMRLAALTAGISLGIENLPRAYGTVLGAIDDTKYTMIWQNHPIRYVAEIIVPTIPAVAAISLMLFMLVFWQSPLESPMQFANYEAGRAKKRIRFASTLALFAIIVSLGQFLYAGVTNYAAITRRGLILPGLLRMASLVSMLLFFLFTFLTQSSSTSLAE